MIGLSLGFGPLESELWRLLFAMTRIGAAMLAAPLFGSASVPVQLRVAISGAIAVLVCTWTNLAVPPAILSATGLVILLGEIAIGLSIGFVLQLSFAAPTLAAELIGGAMGMSIATTVDPNSGASSPALGQYFTVVLTLIFLGLGAHLQWIALIVRSYDSFPPGSPWFTTERMSEVAGFASAMFATGIAIALPVTLVLLLVQLLTGVLSRSAPSLNLFALGLPAGVLAGLAALIVAMPMTTDQLTMLSGSAIEQAAKVVAQ
jgi:flagellar biosynthesis protein FliR